MFRIDSHVQCCSFNIYATIYENLCCSCILKKACTYGTAIDVCIVLTLLSSVLKPEARCCFISNNWITIKYRHLCFYCFVTIPKLTMFFFPFLLIYKHTKPRHVRVYIDLVWFLFILLVINNLLGVLSMRNISLVCLQSCAQSGLLCEFVCPFLDRCRHILHRTSSFIKMQSLVRLEQAINLKHTGFLAQST